MTYEEFLHKKAIVDIPTGVKDIPPLNDMMFDFQKDITAWALRRGRAAIFADCGLGKTIMQLEWAHHVPGDVLILAPLAVAAQTVREGQKFGIAVGHSRDGKKAGKITITNYELLHRFDPSEYTGVVLDESSILKSYTGKYRTDIINSFASTPFKLACTATPAPNDYMELGNHSEFLGVMLREEMLAMFFIHDGGDTAKWRLKGHGEVEYWKWLCSWAVMLRNPSDLGYDDNGFVLPELRIHHHIIKTEAEDEWLFPVPAHTLAERRQARKSTIDERAAKAAEIVAKDPGQWLIWCNLNAESKTLTSAMGAVEIEGADTAEHKETAMNGFTDGDVRVLVTKPSIAGFGMNWQNCHNVVFVGLSDSYEQYYQAVRRCWRFGQDHPVDVHIVTADVEGSVVDNIKRKQKDADAMAENMVEHMHGLTQSELRGTHRTVSTYAREEESTERWTMHLGDCVEVSKEIESDTIGYTIFSPPFASLYTYSNSERDMGNVKDYDQFFEHFNYLVGELYRVTMPGRLLSFHCMNLPTTKTHHGYIGIQDFRGDLIRVFEKAGWIYHSEVVIWKDPVTAMQRTKALGLLHKQIVKDSAMSRQGIPDYVVTMRKPGENPRPVSGPLTDFVGDESTFSNTGNMSIDIWQRYASPIWSDINPSNTLQFRTAREQKDERHICPLQLDVITRCLQLWSLEDDLVLSPFAGIGSEGYEAVRMGRKFIGIELKRSYWEVACGNLRSAETEFGETRLF